MFSVLEDVRSNYRKLMFILSKMKTAKFDASSDEVNTPDRDSNTSNI